MKKNVSFAFIFLFLAFLIAIPKVSANDICCLPGYKPENGQCVNTSVNGFCQSITSGICSLDIAGYQLCALIPASDINSFCLSASFSTGGIISPNFVCTGISTSILSFIPAFIPIGIAVSPIVYNACLPIAEKIFNGMPNLGSLVKTENLCNIGMGNRFYLCFQNGDPNRPGIPTALGCIPYITAQFVSSLLTWSIGVGSGITLITIVWGAVLIISGGHDPKKIQAGKEIIIAAVSGIIMIAISVLLINYLGGQLLNLGPIGFRT